MPPSSLEVGLYCRPGSPTGSKPGSRAARLAKRQRGSGSSPSHSPARQRALSEPPPSSADGSSPSHSPAPKPRLAAVASEETSALIVSLGASGDCPASPNTGQPSARSILSKSTAPPRDSVLANPEYELERTIGGHWTPKNGPKKTKDGEVKKPGETLQVKGNRKGVPADSLLDWFDQGLDLSSGYITGVVPLPGEYTGATKKNALIWQKEAQILVWPVRVDIGNLEESPTDNSEALRPPVTLYHLTHEASFRKFVEIFSSKQRVAMNLLELIQEDYTARRRFDQLGFMTDFVCTPQEPALMSPQHEVFFNTFGAHVPIGHIRSKDADEHANGADAAQLSDCCDYAIPIRVPAMATLDINMPNRRLTKVHFDVLRRQLEEEHDARRAKNALHRSVAVGVQAFKGPVTRIEKLKTFGGRFIPRFKVDKATYAETIVKASEKSAMGMSIFRPDGARKKHVEHAWEADMVDRLLQSKLRQDEAKYLDVQKTEIQTQMRDKDARRGGIVGAFSKGSQKQNAPKITVERKEEDPWKAKKKLQTELDARKATWNKKAKENLNVGVLATNFNSRGSAVGADKLLKSNLFRRSSV